MIRRLVKYYSVPKLLDQIIIAEKFVLEFSFLSTQNSKRSY